ncbi:two-component response regulator ARR22-like [Eucalyptus grandis]|uniref:Response regulatory domain-containing protein n=1 Tax=Eucalyptus globulus TaxID=34317 RepID=A0ABD3KHR6_EUCGL|nr:two-component response regulator ARR22-like [Eucalyptus grandis]
MGAEPDSPERNESSSDRWRGLVLRNRLTALVVDKTTVCRLLVNCFLESVGVETKMAESGQEALEFIGEDYDLILVDRYMNNMDGLETIRRMRERHVRSKIIGLTSGEIEIDRAAMIQAGADDCLEKPLRANALDDILAEIDRR